MVSRESLFQGVLFSKVCTHCRFGFVQMNYCTVVGVFFACVSYLCKKGDSQYLSVLFFFIPAFTSITFFIYLFYFYLLGIYLLLLKRDFGFPQTTPGLLNNFSHTTITPYANVLGVWKTDSVHECAELFFSPVEHYYYNKNDWTFFSRSV